jgi:antitoxin PrlF
MPTTMTVKGQVLMPKHIRERAGIRPGARVDWDIDEQGRPVLIKVQEESADEREQRIRAAIAKARGALKDCDAFPRMSTDEFMAMIREPLP